MSNPFSDNNPYQAPQTPPPQGANSPFKNSAEGDATGGVIPYKNVPSLISYYMGVFSLLPCFGIVIGLGAIILGILGLRTYYANPRLHGLAHAWVGIVLGTFSILAHAAIILSLMMIG